MAVETSEYLAMLDRLIKRAGVRVGGADDVELAQFLALRKTLDEAFQTAVDGQREQGHPWAYIGAAAGTSRWGAQKRWERHE